MINSCFPFIFIQKLMKTLKTVFISNYKHTLIIEHEHSQYYGPWHYVYSVSGYQVQFLTFLKRIMTNARVCTHIKTLKPVVLLNKDVVT